MDTSEQHGSEYWYEYSIWMIRTAKSLQRVAKELEKNDKQEVLSDHCLFEGLFLARPILLSLATEIALKACQCSEREKAHDKTHDLLCLFDSLEQDTREMLESRMRKLSPHSVNADELSGRKMTPDVEDMFAARQQPLRRVLESHRKAFERWRYLYESRSFNTFETTEIDLALTVIIEAYDERLRSRAQRRLDPYAAS